MMHRPGKTRAWNGSKAAAADFLPMNGYIMLKKTLMLASLFSLSLTAQAEPFELADIPVCLSLTPAAISVDNTPLTLDVRVLLDGVSETRAQQVMSDAAQSYTSLGITVVSSYEPVSLSGVDAAGLIDQAKAYYGGTRPEGIDIVYVLTDKDVIDAAATGSALAGLADCIGGVKYDDRAFAVGEAWDSEEVDLAVYTLNVKKAAKTAAHEIGHLMGGHHHQGNCVETLLNIGGSPCTLMFNFIDLQASSFSLLNSIIVRGHGQAYATP